MTNFVRLPTASWALSLLPEFCPAQGKSWRLLDVLNTPRQSDFGTDILEAKMEAVLGTLEHYSDREPRRISNLKINFGRWLGGIFGCQHKEMSRPFSGQGETYRVCISCGARRRFDRQSWNSAGPYYYTPANTSKLRDASVSSLRAA